MKGELRVLEDNNTWELTNLPSGKKPIGWRWIYKVKCKADGTIDKYKVRLVIKGYNQLEGINYYESFSLVAKTVTSTSDSCMFVMNTDECFMVLMVYVDDILLVGNSEEHIKAVKLHLDREFTIKDLGLLKYFLGIEIARSNAGIFISQRKHVRDIVHYMKLQDAHKVASPLQVDWQSYDSNSPLLDDPLYRRLIRRLLYLNFTKPDLTYIVHHLSEFMQHPTVNYWNVAVHVVKYLNGTTTHGIFYASDASLQLQGFCDAD
ncbi:transmembrane signal receptor [Lithospermum erythrorhizon]|uniref:Transmembrane signal receptor n=1 Tax=Lithospermum erythrorhizon TaxID=34254 RepID=A0AAV3Q6L7_LITER